MRRNRSPIWALTEEEINQASSAKALLEQVGLRPFTGNYRTLRKKLGSLGIDYDAFVRRGRAKRTQSNGRRRPVRELLKPGQLLYSRIRARLFEEGILVERCSGCGIGPEWNGQPLVLQIDHVNGDAYDSRLENLRVLCPNCHSQTPTWGARRSKAPPKKCPSCGTTIYRRSAKCRSCAGSDPEVIRKREAGQRRATKIKWPAGKKLAQLVKESNYEAVGRKLGVSGNAVRNRLRRHGAQ